jgi:MFS family permease
MSCIQLGDRFYAFYVLLLLSIIYTLNQIDRSLVSVFAVQMKRELQINDTNFGWLTGFAFSMLLTIFGIVFGYVGDRYNRKITLSICIFVWSVCTVFSGFSRNFWQLLLSRMGLAIGEAAFTPLALSILSNYFSQDYKSIVVSIYNFGIYFGFGFSFLFGLIPQWRVPFWILGGVGVVATILCTLTVIEPDREPVEVKESPISGFKYILSTPSFYFLSIAGGFQYMAGLSYGSWISVFFARIHNQTSQDLAKWIPWIIPVFGCLSMLIGGFLGDFFNRFTLHGRLILTGSVSLLVLLPTIPLFLVNQVVWAYILMIPKVLVFHTRSHIDWRNLDIQCNHHPHNGVPKEILVLFSCPLLSSR